MRAEPHREALDLEQAKVFAVHVNDRDESLLDLCSEQQILRALFESVGKRRPPVGAFPDAVYDESRCVLRPGDVFVAYTDGIT